IFIGAFTLTLTNGLGSGIQKYIDKQLGNFGAKDVFMIQATNDDSSGGHMSSDQPKKYDPAKRTASIASEGNRTVAVLTEKDIEKIKATKGIKSVSPYLAASVDYVAGSSNGKY